MSRDYEDYYDLRKETEEEIEKLENKVSQLVNLFNEQSKKTEEYITELKNIEKRMLEIYNL
jgi:peptidoglycan hydrolase CwlO-like protein